MVWSTLFVLRAEIGVSVDFAMLATVNWSGVFDCLAVVIGAVTGAMFAVSRKLDIVGAVAIALVTAYGGGIMRDLLLQSHGFFFMDNPHLIVISAVIALFVFILGDRAEKFEGSLFYADALSMAWFALAGVNKSWDAGTGVVIAIVLGTVTAVGGGLLRNVCVGETPAIFKEGNFYALSALAGTAFFVACSTLGAPLVVSSIGCVCVAFGLTWASRHFGWRTKPRSE